MSMVDGGMAMPGKEPKIDLGDAMNEDVGFPDYNPTGYPGTDYNSDYEYPDFRPKWYELTNERKRTLLNALTIVLVAFLIISFIRFHLDGVKNWWRRRVAAARYKRHKKDDTSELETAHDDAYMSGAEDEPSIFETLKASLTRDVTASCTIDLGTGGATHTIDASVGKLEKVSELPFFLQEACRFSGVGELAALSLVDLWLKHRALIEVVPAGGGSPAEVGPGTTPLAVRRAKSFRVTILPQSTR